MTEVRKKQQGRSSAQQPVRSPTLGGGGVRGQSPSLGADGGRLFGIAGTGGPEATFGLGFGEQQGGLAHWRSQIAVLGGNPTPGDEAVLLRLGDRLWAEANEVTLSCLPAHLPDFCTSSGACSPEPFHPNPWLCIFPALQIRCCRAVATKAVAVRVCGP
jgi:hypothetical protein